MEVELLCKYCDKTFSYSKKLVKYRLKENPNTKFYCSDECRKNGTRKGKLIKCFNCDKECYRTASALKQTKSGNVFCSSSCSASFNNSIRKKSNKNKFKNCQCKICGNTIMVSKYMTSSKAVCKECKKKRNRRHFLNDKTYICKICNNNFLAKEKRKTCSPECLHIARVKSGINSANSQARSRRSANELHFAKLCKDRFTKVLENENIFKDKNDSLWDADIILPDKKVAVLWNGAWHYKKIHGNHSLKQIQTRDKIKLEAIKKTGYTPYIIKDMGRENSVFVKDQFDIFINWLEHIKA